MSLTVIQVTMSVSTFNNAVILYYTYINNNTKFSR